MNEKEYLGDSVYITIEDYGYVLTTENGMGPSNTIYMDPSVVMAFINYIKRVTGKETL